GLDLLTDTTHSFLEGSLVSDSNSVLWYCWDSGTGTGTDGAGVSPISIIPAFLPLSRPTRVYDSRDGAGQINGNVQEERTIQIAPAGVAILSVLMNVTVVNTTGSGYLSIFSADASWDPDHPFSSMNWFTDNQITANMVVSAINHADGTVKVRAGGVGTTHV